MGRERERESKGGRLHYTMGLNEQEARGGSSLSSSPAQLHENIDLSSLSLEQEEASVACEDASCPICLNDVPFVDTAILSCCRTQFCIHCILKWVLKKQETGTGAQCPICRTPFDTLCTHRYLDGTLSDTLVTEHVCLLLRADWALSAAQHAAFCRKGKAQLSTSPTTRKLYGADDYLEACEDDRYEDEDEEEEDYYMYDRSNRGGGGGGSSSSSSGKILIGNRRWGAHGYMRDGRMYARPSNSNGGKGKGKGKAVDNNNDDDEYKPRYESPSAKKTMGRRATRSAKRALRNKGSAKTKDALDRAIC